METKRQQKFGRQIQKDLSDIFQKEYNNNPYILINMINSSKEFIRYLRCPI